MLIGTAKGKRARKGDCTKMLLKSEYLARNKL
jgi:hypothetical protein